MRANISYALSTLLATSLLALGSGALVGSAYADVESKKSRSGIVLDTDGGFSLETKDGRYGFNIGGQVQYDYNEYDGSLSRAENPPGVVVEEFEARRLRLNLAGHAAGWNFKLGYDFEDASDADGDAGLTDAYVRYTGAGNWAILTFGRHKVPFSMDELTKSTDILAMERNVLTDAFAPGRRPGISIGGYSKHFSYQVTVFDEDTSEFGENADASLAARVTWAPLTDQDFSVHVGVAGMDRDVSSGADEFTIENRVTTEVQVITSPFEIRTARVGNDLVFGPMAFDGIIGLGLEFGLSGRGFLFQAEYVDVEFADPEIGDTTIDVGADFDGYSAQFSWILTGESHEYDASKGVFKRPRAELVSGAWEVFVRYSSIDLRTPRGVQNFASVADDYNAITYGVNWYSNDNLRVSMNYVTSEINRFARQNHLAIPVQTNAQLVDGDAFSMRIQYVF